MYHGLGTSGRGTLIVGHCVWSQCSIVGYVMAIDMLLPFNDQMVNDECARALARSTFNDPWPMANDECLTIEHWPADVGH
eukprot:3800135-Lingulodinium_polyedra.AAC.1